MRIAFDPAARTDLDDIFAWISKNNISAAYEMIARIGAILIQFDDRLAYYRDSKAFHPFTVG